MTGIQIALQGLREAASSITTDDEDRSIIRASEALFWAAALDEQSDPGRRHRLAPATEMARNAVAHGVVICGAVRDGLTWPLVWPLKWVDFAWAPTQAVLAGLSRPVKQSTVDLYETELAGKSVSETLASLVSWYEERVG